MIPPYHLGVPVSDHRAVGRRDHAVTVGVLVFDHTRLHGHSGVVCDVRNALLEDILARGGIDVEIRSLVDAVENIAVDQAQRLTDAGRVVVTRVIAVPARRGHHLLRSAGQRTQFVADERNVEIGRPAEAALRGDVRRVDRNLDTLVANLTHIHPLRRETRDIGAVGGHQQVLRILEEEIRRDVQAVAEQA